MAEGTVTRLAALQVLEQLRPNDTVTICLTLRRQPGFISLYSDKAYITRVHDTEERLDLLQALVDAIESTWGHRIELVAMTS